jgi:hypothetical protein
MAAQYGGQHGGHALAARALVKFTQLDDINGHGGILTPVAAPGSLIFALLSGIFTAYPARHHD